MIPNAEELLSKAPSITREQQEEIVDNFPAYAFYRRIKGGTEYYCTSCHRWQTNSTDNRTYSLPAKWKHNENYTCPYCGREVTAKAAGRGRKWLRNYAYFVIYSASNNRLYARVVKVYQMFYNDELEPEYDTELRYLYVFEKNRMQKFNRIYNPQINCIVWNPMKSNTGLPKWSYITNTHYEESILITPEEIYKTDLKYSEVETFSPAGYEQIEYLIEYVKHNNLEYIVKSGFKRIAEEVVFKRNSKKAINWRSNNLLKMLGIRKGDIEAVKVFSIDELQAYQYVIKNVPSIKNPIAFAATVYSCGIDEIEKIRSMTNLSIKQIFRYAENAHQILLWKDYLEMSQKLPGGIGEIKPKNLRAAHDRVLEESNFLAKKAGNKHIKERIEFLQDFVYETDKLFIRVPESGEEIVIEGKCLKHCVGGYVQRHADGKTNIMFIRKKSAPDTPYFTIEVSNDYRIVQCHGYRNEAVNSKPDEIIEFEKQYKSFLEELKNVRNNSQRTA